MSGCRLSHLNDEGNTPSAAAGGIIANWLTCDETGARETGRGVVWVRGGGDAAAYRRQQLYYLGIGGGAAALPATSRRAHDRELSKTTIKFIIFRVYIVR